RISPRATVLECDTAPQRTEVEFGSRRGIAGLHARGHRTGACAQPAQPLLPVESLAVLRHTRGPRQSPSPMQIRIIKKPPAPRMDGWDVSAFCVGQECEVESRIGNYLIIAGYAVPVERDGKP